nr:hypothetical protein [uncultured Actinoplanes sp.]
MKNSIGRVAAAAAAVVAAATSVAAGPGAAYASDVNPGSATALCGSGYSIVDSHGIDGGIYVYLLYSSATKKNCAVTFKQKNIGTRNNTEVYIISQETHKTADDFGSYTSYAGRVYLSAPGECVKYGGQVQYGTTIYSWDSSWVACG